MSTVITFERKKLPMPWLVLHWAIILNFVFQVGYAAYIVFFVTKPAGVTGPLGKVAVQLIKDNPNLMLVRRAYATEFWIAMSGLAIYLALTEILPRLWNVRQSEV